MARLVPQPEGFCEYSHSTPKFTIVQADLEKRVPCIVGRKQLQAGTGLVIAIAAGLRFGSCVRSTACQEAREGALAASILAVDEIDPGELNATVWLPVLKDAVVFDLLDFVDQGFGHLMPSSGVS